MSFGNPWAFAYLALLPLFAGYGLWANRRTRGLLERAGEPALLEALVDEGSRADSVRWLQRASLSLAFILVCFALARPQFGLRTEVLRGRGMDVVLALDLSRSMHARDVVPSRLERAKIELRALLEEIRGDRVALIGFTSVGLPLAPLTVDHAVIKLQLDSASPDDLPRGGTSLDAAIRASLKLLDAGGQAESDKAIVVISDGEAHLGQPVAAAEAAVEQGVSVHLAGIGSRLGEPIPMVSADGSITGYVKDRRGKTVVSRLEDTALREVAAASKGILTLPSKGGGIDLRPIVEELKTLKRAQLDERTIEIKEERYMWVLAPAFLCLLLATIFRRARSSALPRLVLALPLLLHPKTAAAQDTLQRVHPKVQEGLDALQAGQNEKALEAFKEAERTLGRDPRLRFNQALADAAAGELDRAMVGFRQVAQNAGDASLRAKAKLALGNAQRKLDRLDEAIEAYRSAVLEDPSLGAARRNLEIASRMKVVQEAQPKQENEDGESEPGGENNPGDPPKDQESKDDPTSKEDPPSGDEKQEQEQNQDGKSDDDGNEGQDPASTEPQDEPDAGQAEDASSATADDSPDAGTDDGGGAQASSGGQADGGETPDGGTAGPAEAAPSAPPPDLSEQEAEALLDALQAEEKAAKRKRLLRQFKGRPVEKDW